MAHAARFLDAWPLATHVADRRDRETACLPRTRAPAAQEPAACACLERPRVNDAARANARRRHIGKRHAFFSHQRISQSFEARVRRGKRRNRFHVLFGIGLFQATERADNESCVRNMSGKLLAEQWRHRRQPNEKSLRLKRRQTQRCRGTQRRAQRHALFLLVELPVELERSAGQ